MEIMDAQVKVQVDGQTYRILMGHEPSAWAVQLYDASGNWRTLDKNATIPSKLVAVVGRMAELYK